MTFTDDRAAPSCDFRGKRVWVAGHTGMVGSALVRRLQREDCDILTVDHSELDLTRQAETEDWMRSRRPDMVFMAAARVGGIAANARYPVEFLYTNAMIALNTMRVAADIGVSKYLWMASSCVYPKFAEQPIRETALLGGHLEETNQAYAIAKICGIKLAEAYASQYGKPFMSVMPTNIYGPGDNFELESAHVLPALLRKMHEAKAAGRQSIILLGTGTPTREFLHADDLADGCIYVMKHYHGTDLINIGSGEELSIRELATIVAEVVGFGGHIVCDTSKPDGTARKRLDISKVSALGWRPAIELKEGIRDLYLRWQRSGYSARASYLTSRTGG
ncbi:GDP-L-fucose synthase family protein [Rhizobium sp. Root482]|uniref:GDP-L-fucose synthase family protein n=1 Tax=Rhizobium sp. Root482 TaxID=1736543 RepID=UPI0006FF0405|nr:GDP-L-fucose synthase [Rhizobium sp. Root482]KQY26672.1 GDP-fucose synthetase [Rhizobium sp. Root482]